MNVFVFFAPNFLEWPLAVCRELARRDPAHRFSGLVHGSRRGMKRAASSTDPTFEPLDHLDGLERGWLATSCDDRVLARFEASLGSAAVRRIVTADRQIGIGFVSNADVATTRLMETCRDGEMVRRYVAGLLEYLSARLDRDRPDLVFAHTVAGAVARALSTLCGQRGIPFLQLAHTRVGDRFVLDDHHEAGLGPVRRAFAAALVDPSRLQHALPEARAHLAEFRERPQVVSYARWQFPRYLESISIRTLLRRTLEDARALLRSGLRDDVKYLRVLTPRRRIVHRLRTGLRARRLIRRGPFLPPGRLPERPFVYFPLHYSPEQSTQVMAPMHTDQIAVIEALVKSLPLTLNLVVKEHLPMLGLRPPGFYERLAAMPGVVLASPFENSLELVQRSELTCVITGTAGWEAMLLGRPTLVLGDFPYLAVGEGVSQCQDLSRLPEALPQALQLKPAEDARLELFLAAIFDQSFELDFALFEGKPSADQVGAAPEIVRSLADRLLALSARPGGGAQE